MHLILTLASLALAQEKASELKENPAYRYWASCKVGSWVRVSLQIEQGGEKVDLEQVQKLIELKDEMAVVEMSGKMKRSVGEVPIPAQKQEIKAKEPADRVKIDKEGDEEIDAAGRKLACHWYELGVQAGSKPMKLKVWMS
ncbi:MAG TPA: hypothetical protein VEN81_17020, partial [Planctomycetota bacterium]|nr:hypothetical protein [Planctomycetota bacterium]